MFSYRRGRSSGARRHPRGAVLASGGASGGRAGRGAASRPRLTDREMFRAAAPDRVKEKSGQKGKALFHPIRAGADRRAEGPELDLLVPAIDRGADCSPADGLARSPAAASALAMSSELLDVHGVNTMARRSTMDVMVSLQRPLVHSMSSRCPSRPVVVVNRGVDVRGRYRLRDQRRGRGAARRAACAHSRGVAADDERVRRCSTRRPRAASRAAAYDRDARPRRPRRRTRASPTWRDAGGDTRGLARRRRPPPLIVVLDGVEDPHNVGAILRTRRCGRRHRRGAADAARGAARRRGGQGIGRRVHTCGSPTS